MHQLIVTPLEADLKRYSTIAKAFVDCTISINHYEIAWENRWLCSRFNVFAALPLANAVVQVSRLQS